MSKKKTWMGKLNYYFLQWFFINIVTEKDEWTDRRGYVFSFGMLPSLTGKERIRFLFNRELVIKIRNHS